MGQPDADVEAELHRFELKLMQPEFRRDRRQVEALLAEDFQEFGASGRIWTREATLNLLAGEIFTAPRITDFACRMLSGRVALVTYKSVRVGKGAIEQVEVLRSSIWIRSGERWRMRFHQGTRTAGSDGDSRND